MHVAGSGGDFSRHEDHKRITVQDGGKVPAGIDKGLSNKSCVLMELPQLPS